MLFKVKYRNILFNMKFALMVMPDSRTGKLPFSAARPVIIVKKPFACATPGMGFI